MKKQDIARRIARQSGVTPAEAADRLDRIVHQILADLRKGGQTSLPGLGTFTKDGNGYALFQRERGVDGASKN